MLIFAFVNTSPMPSATESYLESARKQFLYYKMLGEKAMAQLQPDQLFYTPDEDTNSIAIIVKHLHGNMLSRWTDFLISDGEKEWRNRDDEFEDTYPDKEALMAGWKAGWQCLFTALDTVTSDNLSSIIYIRNEGHTVVEAINRQLAHYPYHIGQIVFYAKMLKQTAWDSLSIPKNKSANYNAGKFSQEKAIRNLQITSCNAYPAAIPNNYEETVFYTAYRNYTHSLF